MISSTKFTIKVETETAVHTTQCRYNVVYLLPNPHTRHPICIKALLRTGPWFNIKMSSYQYRKPHCGDKTILRPSYLHNGISYTGKMASLYWIGAQKVTNADMINPVSFHQFILLCHAISLLTVSFLEIYQKSGSTTLKEEHLARLSTNGKPIMTCSLFHDTVSPKKYAHGFVVLCFVVVMQSFIMNSHEVFIHIHQGCFAGTGAIVRLPQCQWSKPDGYGKISQCITTTKHSKAKTVCIFLGIYCMWPWLCRVLFCFVKYSWGIIYIIVYLC